MGFEQLYIHDVLESFITMVDFSNRDLNLNNSTSVQPTNQPTTEQQEVVKKDLPKAIFANMTKFEAEEAGLLDTFIAANSDGDDVLTQEEVESYNAKNQPQQEISSSSTTTSIVDSSVLEEKESPIQENNKEEVVSHEQSKNSENPNSLPLKPLDHIKIPDILTNPSLNLPAIVRISGAATVDLDRYKDIIPHLMKQLNCSQEDAIKYLKSTFTKQANEHFNNTMALLSYNPNDVDWDNVQTLDQEQLKTARDVLSYDYCVHDGLTREEAESIKGKVLVDFNKICPQGKDKITEADILLYKKKQLEEQGISIESIVKTYNTSDKKNKMAITSMFIGTVANENYVQNKFKNVDEIYEQLGIDKNLFANASAEQKGKILGDALRKTFSKEFDITDKNSKLYQEIIRIDNEEFNEYEKQHGFKKHSFAMNQDEVRKLAAQNLRREYLSTIAYLSQSVYESEKDEDKAVVIQSLFGALEENPMLRMMLESLGIQSMTEGSDLQRETSDAVAKNESESKQLDVSTIGGAMVTEAIVTHSSEEAITEFIQAYPEQVEAINNIVNDVVEYLPEGKKKEFIQNIINNVIVNIQQQNSESRSEKTSKAGNATQSGNAVTGNNTAVGNNAGRYSAADIAPFVTNPQQSVGAKEVADLRSQSEAFYNTSSSVVKQPTKSEIQKQQFIALQQEMHARRVKMRASLQSKSLSEVIGVMFDHYNQMPADIKLKFVAHIQALDPDTQCETYIKGSDDLKKFMRKNNAMNNEKMINYFKKHPAELARANKSVQVEYMKAQAEQIKHETGATLTSTLSSQDPKKVSHWHEYPFWNK